MADSLRRLTKLPGHMRVHSGHGPMTTIGEELTNNPFLGYIRDERGIAGLRDFRGCRVSDCKNTRKIGLTLSESLFTYRSEMNGLVLRSLCCLDRSETSRFFDSKQFVDLGHQELDVL